MLFFFIQLQSTDEMENIRQSDFCTLPQLLAKTGYEGKKIISDACSAELKMTDAFSSPHGLLPGGTTVKGAQSVIHSTLVAERGDQEFTLTGFFNLGLIKPIFHQT